MNPARFLPLLIFSLISLGATCQPTVYLSTPQSLSTRQTPAWFGNAKLGIFIHWGLYSVPAWATPSTTPDRVTDWPLFYKNNPYAEWYLNTLRIAGSPTRQHHTQTYGAGFDYYQFKDSLLQKTKNWDASQWARLFKQTGARYVVFTTKHHDGFTLYPSQVKNPMCPAENINSPRDYVGELAAEVRNQGLKFGVYYSGGLDWTFYRSPITNLWPDLFESMPKSVAYTMYADCQMYELIHRYSPDVLWNDVNYPKNGDVLGIFAELVNTNPNAVINNRWQQYDSLTDFTTPEYQVLDSISSRKWETCRGIGYSFGYNRIENDEQLLSSNELIDLLIDVVSKNGNLLLNVGPKADGTIPENQLSRLIDLGQWLDINGQGIFDTRPWKRASQTLADGTPVRFTQKQDTLYAFLLQPTHQKQLVITGCKPRKDTQVKWVGAPSGKLSFKPLTEGISIELPKNNTFPFAGLICISGIEL